MSEEDKKDFYNFHKQLIVLQLNLYDINLYCIMMYQLMVIYVCSSFFG